MTIKHYLKFDDLTAEETNYLFKRAITIKERVKSGQTYEPLKGNTLAMIFEKASTRTRVSFESGFYQLGGNVIHITTGDSQMGRKEPIQDTSRCVSRMTDLVMIRTYGQDKIEAFAKYSVVPVINGLTNEFHPCQVLADIMTFIEHRGPIIGKTVAWIGDANNMSNTWAVAAQMLDFKLQICTPSEYPLNPELAPHGDHLVKCDTPLDAAADADLVTTDVWASMGDEAEAEARQKAFEGYCVDKVVMAAAKKDALFMHCLPAHRGEEVTEEVLEGEQSVAFDEAENRMHAQKALMEYLLLGKDVM